MQPLDQFRFRPPAHVQLPASLRHFPGVQLRVDYKDPARNNDTWSMFAFEPGIPRSCSAQPLGTASSIRPRAISPSAPFNHARVCCGSPARVWRMPPSRGDRREIESPPNELLRSNSARADAPAEPSAMDGPAKGSAGADVEPSGEPKHRQQVAVFAWRSQAASDPAAS